MFRVTMLEEQHVLVFNCWSHFLKPRVAGSATFSATGGESPWAKEQVKYEVNTDAFACLYVTI
jgi:hypothetical protein